MAEARALSEVTPFQIWLQMAHRFVAVLIVVGAVVVLVRARARGEKEILSRLTTCWVLLLACQIDPRGVDDLEQQGGGYRDGSCGGWRHHAGLRHHHFCNGPAIACPDETR